MTEFLIRDGWTGRETWVAGATAREAVIEHENALRSAPDRHPCRPADRLASTARATHGLHNRPDLIDVRIADCSCVGHPQAVSRQ